MTIFRDIDRRRPSGINRIAKNEISFNIDDHIYLIKDEEREAGNISYQHIVSQFGTYLAYNPGFAKRLNQFIDNNREQFSGLMVDFIYDGLWDSGLM